MKRLDSTARVLALAAVASLWMNASVDAPLAGQSVDHAQEFRSIFANPAVRAALDRLEAEAYDPPRKPEARHAVLNRQRRSP